ncbi:MAG: O-antigen ligase family protein [Candidatus Microgenomates bacterium]
MIQSWKRIEKFANLLLIFLLPSQLALHFWPNFAFVFGIRVDYLAPSVYFTDVLFLVLFTVWVVMSKKIFLDDIYKNKLYIIVFILVAVVNTAFSTSFYVSLLKWLKITELLGFAYYVYKRRDIVDQRDFSVVLFCSLIFFSLIGIAQFFKGGTLGGILYFLGERSFSISTPGIALVHLGGSNWLRAYSTFPHPNALAGYLVVGVLMLSGFIFDKQNCWKIAGVLIILLAFILTFSLAGLLSICFCGILFVFIKKGILKKKLAIYLVSGLFVFGLAFPVISSALFTKNVSYRQDIAERLELAFVSGKIISGNFWVGTGLNTFIINEVKVVGINGYVWLLQPVHNIYLLTFSEVGIFGIILLFLIFYLFIRRNLSSDRLGLLLAVIFIMTTGLADHYWLTLQQNMFLLVLLAGNSFAVKD